MCLDPYEDVYGGETHECLAGFLWQPSTPYTLSVSLLSRTESGDVLRGTVQVRVCVRGEGPKQEMGRQALPCISEAWRRRRQLSTLAQLACLPPPCLRCRAPTAARR